ncbi:related to dedicator of cytokinesis protein 3 [Sporisorium reilianum SRZ2]|uniref:Related to dedicator of cytokinesis protein 3 n=1 Tax=Sporisorium reilianum (strain SRZ2) TaxID=999809 RepID=E6ZTM8_SPORE|nr:related to dedicator of cytokinesis protein 3 [Sporisorium reilianum SRZ2]
MASSSSYRRWEPVPKILYGLATHPFSPETDLLESSTVPLESLPADVVQNLQENLIALELGDEVYAFEQLGHSDVKWYRGYVVSSTRLPTTAASASSLSDYSTFHALGQHTGTAVDQEPQVYVGVFPTTHVHIREQLDDAEMRLAAVYEHAQQLGVVGANAPLPRQRAQMETLPELDESASLPSSPNQQPTAQLSSIDGRIQEVGLNGQLVERPPPPLPSLKCGDETNSGVHEPLVDEIACALREWSALMYVYLGQRDYDLLNAVKDQIEVLYMARKQLLAQTLSAEEVAKLRRDCVARLVKANVAQGLDVIVRHPGRGGLVDFDINSKDADPDSWVSGIRLFALQAALAYVDQQDDSAANVARGGMDLSASNAFGITSPTTTSAGVLAGVSNDYSRNAARQGSVASIGARGTDITAASSAAGAKYFHVFVDLRAFVATPCTAGEVVELYFSLYNRAESRFLTEEFCVILNHRSVPANDATGKLGKMRALFTELSASDMQDLNVVCRIVRNGGMRVGDIKATPLGAAGQDQPPDRVDAFADPSLANTPSFRPKRMAGDHSFRRPFGCAVLELGQHHHFQTDVASSSTMREHVMPIFVPVNEAAFSTLHQDIIASRTREFEKSPRADMLAVNIKVFHGQTAAVIRENPSLLQDTPPTARLGFPDVVFPGDPRNEAYIKLWSGEFYPPGNKMAGNALRNIQVSAEVRTRDGRVVEHVISRGAGESLITQFDSLVFYHQNAPTWGELIKLQLPHDIMEDCHLFFSFRHRSTKEERGSAAVSNGTHATVASQSSSSAAVSRPFAYGYLPLFESNRAFIPDGSHTLFLWRTSRPPGQIGPDLYFNLPPVTPAGRSLHDVVPPSLASTVQPLRDILTLRTFLVSTKYSQNDVLLKLLNWERLLAEDYEELRSVLNQFTFVGEVEIVKFLRDIFDSLFGIATSSRNTRGDLDDLVFNGLVTVLGIVQDRRFNNFRATLDIYIERHFKFTTAHNKLIASMSKLMADPSRPETSKDLRAAIKVWPYLFKFAIQSRENQRGDRDVGGGAVLDHLEAGFKRELEGLLQSINQLMSATKPSSIIGTQTLALQHFAGILPDLARVFTTDELVRTATAFADSVFITKGKMVIWKLLHILQLTQGPLFEEQASRSQLIPSVVRWISPHLGSYDEAAHAPANAHENARDAARVSWLEAARLAVTILAVILDRLQVSLASGSGGAANGARVGNKFHQEQDDVDYLLSMLPKLLETYRELSSRATIRTLERHRAPSTTPSPIPVIFPSSYPFSLVAKRPQGEASVASGPSSRRSRRRERAEFLNCGLVEISAVLMVLIVLSPRKHLSSFLDEERDLGGDERTSKILFDFFEVATSILSYEAFPSTWLNLNIFSHQMVLKMADPIASMMVRHYIPSAEHSDSFDTTLWRSCLTMVLTLLSSDQLVIEQFKPQRRRAVWRLAGDIRGEGAQIFAKLWTSIGWPEKAAEETHDDATSQPDERMNTGGFQVQFVPSLVEPVLELCLSHHDELRTCAVRVLATMITSEWHLNGDFTVIEAEIIDKLDILFMTHTKGDEISRAFFIGQLRALFDNPNVDAGLREQVNACLVSVNRFLDLLLSVRSLPLEEGYEDDRIAGTLKLLGFLRQANRVSAFSTHVLRLVNLHLENLNYVEAALTLKLHADLHSWDMDSFVEPIPDLDLPRQSHFARKETLYMLILDYLGKGQAWEISVDICRELAQQYEFRSVNYSRLAEVLQHQAKLYQKIANEERSFPAYFRVAYYGQEWPPSLQNKMFVYRGHDWEKFTAFCDRLHAKHPKAILIKSAAVPDDEVRASEGQFLQVTAVQPEPDRARDVFTNPEVPPTVRAYYENSGTDLFSFVRPLNKEGAASSEQWVEKTYLRCEDAFPTVLRRSEVAEVFVVEISPLEKALEDVRSKTAELETLEKKYSSIRKVSTGKINTNRLSMALNSAVDAPADDGVPMYKRTFFAPEYLATHEDQQQVVDELRQAIDVQATVLFRCIRLHAQLCPPEMKPFHETLERFYIQNFSDEIQHLDLDVRKLGRAGSGSFEHTSAVGASGRSMEEDPRRSPERTMSRGFTTGMGAIDRAANGNGFSAADEGRQDLQTSAQTGYGRRGNVAQSPLQRHIAFLTRQADPLTPTKEAASATVQPVHSAMSRSDSNNSLTLGGSGSYADRSITASGSKILPPISEDMLGGVAAMPAAAPAPALTNERGSPADYTVHSSTKASMSRNESSHSIADMGSIKGGSTPAKQSTSQGPGNRLSKLMGGVGRRKASHS